MKRITGTLLALFAVLFLAPALAQDVFGDYDVREAEPFGDVDLTYDPYDDEFAGAIVLSHSTPGDQHANFDVVGPDDYWEHFDFSDEPNEERVLEGLRPGVYSVAATDENLNLSHTLVEVTAGEAVSVHFNLDVWEEAYVAGTYDPYAYYGRYGADGVYPGYPYGAYGVTPYSPYATQGFGALQVNAVDENIDFIVTGPNGYSEEFEGSFLAEDLWPGVYVVAATEEGLDLAVTTVEVQAERQLALEPQVIVLDETELEQAEEAVGEDVAGGGVGEDEAADDIEAEEEIELDVDEEGAEQNQQQDGEEQDADQY